MTQDRSGELLASAKALIRERRIGGVEVTHSAPGQDGVEVVWMRGRQLQYIEDATELREFLLMIHGIQKWGVLLAGEEDEESPELLEEYEDDDDAEDDE